MLRFKAKLGLEFRYNASETFNCACAHWLELDFWVQSEGDRRWSDNVKGTSLPTPTAHVAILVPGKYFCKCNLAITFHLGFFQPNLVNNQFVVLELFLNLNPPHKLRFVYSPARWKSLP